MINAEQITARLRMMSDSDLQRFAEMNKKDPYLFPLAFNESNMRKKVRMAGAAQQAAPQPPVNEQAVAAMTPAQLPENQGIGVLNPNLQFADGGLVAFAAGGDTEYSTTDDSYSGEIPDAYAYGGAVRFAGGGTTEYWPQNMYERPKPRYLFPPTMMSDRRLVGEREIEAATKKADEQRAAEELNPETWRYRDVVTKPPVSAAPSAVPPRPSIAPAAATTTVSPRVAAASVSPSQFRTASDIKQLYAKAASEEQRIADQRVVDYLKDRPEPETFEEQKALLKEAAADVEKQQRMDEGLAWLTFASKVMTPGMNPIQALVEGAAAGTSQYAAAQKDLKKAERERKMGLASLAQAERAAKRQDYDAVEQFRLKAAESADRARQAGIDATARAYGTDATLAAQMYDSALNRAASAANVQAQIASQERLAGRTYDLKTAASALNSDAKLMAEFNDFVKSRIDLQTAPIDKQIEAFRGARALLSGTPQVISDASKDRPR